MNVGAFEFVSGQTSETTVSGGIEVVSGRGVAFSADILSGGVQYLVSGGTALGTIVSSGGQQNLAAGGRRTSRSSAAAAS